MSVARARLLEPLYKVDVPLTHTAVVIGGGVAGMTAAAALGDMGHEVHLVEREAALGGRVLELDQTIKGSRPADFAAALEQRVIDNPNVKIHLDVDARGLPRLHRQLLERHRRRRRRSARPSTTAS